MGGHLWCRASAVGTKPIICLFLFLRVSRPGSEVSVSNRVRGLEAGDWWALSPSKLQHPQVFVRVGYRLVREVFCKCSFD